MYLFVVTLFFLFLGGDHGSYANINNKARSLQVHDTHLQPSKFTVTGKGHTAIKSALPGTENEHFIGYEDDDENQVSARKYVLLDRYFLVVSYALVLSYIYNSLKKPLPLCEHLSYVSSYKYIVQRALRI